MAEGAEADHWTIKRAKKEFLHAVGLDGRAPGLGEHPLDVSKAHAICAELDDPTRAGFHRAVIENKPLLRFLTRGDVGHSRDAADYFPQVTRALPCTERGFRAFLSEPFAKQFNLVLTRAIQQRSLAVIEALLTAPRCVVPEDEDVCFEGACRRVDELVELMRSKAAEGKQRKIGLVETEAFLGQHVIPHLFNLLPDAFAPQRFWPTDCFVEWRDASTEMRNGDVVVASRRQPDATVAVPMGDTDNAVLLPIIQEMMKDQPPVLLIRDVEAPPLAPAPAPITKASGWGWTVAVACFVVLGIALAASNSGKTSSTGGGSSPPQKAKPSLTQTPSTTRSWPTSSPTKAAMPSPATGTTRLDDLLELESDRRQIEIEKAKATRMGIEFETLAAEVSRKKLSLKVGYSKYELAAYEQLVQRHKNLLDALREQHGRISLLLDSYNLKLRRTP